MRGTAITDSQILFSMHSPFENGLFSLRDQKSLQVDTQATQTVSSCSYTKMAPLLTKWL